MPSFRDSPNGAPPAASTNPVLEREQSQWLFTPQELLRSPSILDGMTPEQELINRQKGVNFITQVGIMLKLPQLTLATASVYLHRLFMRQKMPTERSAGLHHYSAAATALFLATKVEENCRKMKELVVACCRVAQKQPNLVVDEQNKEYWKWRDTVLHNEDVLLEALCFDLDLVQPYRILFEFLQYYGVQDHKNLRNTSWAFLNDSHVTTMCLLHTPRAIAGAALYTGIRLANLTLPDDEQGRSWWEHLELDVVEIQAACNLMFDVYDNPTLPRVGAKDAYIKEDDMSFLERTRGMLTPRTDMSPTQSVRSVSQLSGTKRDRDEAEGQQEEEWGAPSAAAAAGQTNRSPKRQRVDTPEVDRPVSRVPPGSRIPPAAVNGGSRVPSRVPPSARVPPPPPPSDSQGIDDVQQRIDDIVNANSRQNSENNVPTLSQLNRDRPPAADSERRSSREDNSAGGESRRLSANGGGTDNGRPRSQQSNVNAPMTIPIGDARRPNGGPTKGRQEAASDANEKGDSGSEEGEV
jgi:protein BUR2